MSRPPLPFQPLAGGDLPRTLRETYAAALRDVERELRASEAALRADDSNENRRRYARSLFTHDRLSSMFPFVAAGACDACA